MPRNQISLAEQRERTAQLDAIRLHRRLNGDEEPKPIVSPMPRTFANGAPASVKRNSVWPKRHKGSSIMQLLDLTPSVPVASIEDVITERVRQVKAFGHSPAADASYPLRHLPLQARAYLDAAMDEIQFRKPGWEARARRKLTQAGALALAAIDRFDMEGTIS